MATTKLWHIKGRLKDLIDYVENPAKTASPHLQDFFDVFAYAQNPEKTAQGDFVTAMFASAITELRCCSLPIFRKISVVLGSEGNVLPISTAFIFGGSISLAYCQSGAITAQPAPL